MSCAGEPLRPSEVIAHAVSTGELSKEDTHIVRSADVVVELAEDPVAEVNAGSRSRADDEDEEETEDSSKEART